MVSTNTFTLHQSLNAILRRPTVEQLTGDARSTIYRKINLKLFPKPVQIGGDRVGWPANEVQAVIDARIAGKSEQQIQEIVKRLELARGGNQ